MSAVDKLLKGYQDYRDGSYEQSRPLIENLVAQGQRPEVAVIACSDSRVDPAILFQADPGDLFVIRNVANLVPLAPVLHWNSRSWDSMSNTW
jgi:carbonic anhydrase